MYESDKELYSRKGIFADAPFTAGGILRRERGGGAAGGSRTFHGGARFPGLFPTIGGAGCRRGGFPAIPRKFRWVWK